MLFDNFSAIDNHNIGDFYGLLRGLWNDPGIKEAFERRSEFHLPDSMGYFYDHLDRIIIPDYVPTQQVYVIHIVLFLKEKYMYFLVILKLNIYILERIFFDIIITLVGFRPLNQ